ncbi:MAG: FmdB family transcriptional regulator [Candidatus Marinimicrobia bacterium CG08_land_8_20_14_0_20_45_22]|nr:MAG: FmdB family transcriptional regulator [Candidatus Marinimicrobia bacterium CG08_land_8_20_14_0_20_45_22]
MPTYEYVCDNCGYEFENFQSMSSEPLTICPKCGKATVHRRISGGVGLIFKGSGFYITDYAKRHSETNSSAGSEPKSTTVGKSKKAGKTEPKPVANTEIKP